MGHGDEDYGSHAFRGYVHTDVEFRRNGDARETMHCAVWNTCVAVHGRCLGNFGICGVLLKAELV